MAVVKRELAERLDGRQPRFGANPETVLLVENRDDKIDKCLPVLAVQKSVSAVALAVAQLKKYIYKFNKKKKKKEM